MIWNFIFTIGLFVLSYLTRPKNETTGVTVAGLDDLKVPTQNEGIPIPILWGRARINSPNVVWFGDFHTQSITKDRSLIAVRYQLAVQFALCRGTIDAVTAIYVDDEGVWSGSLGSSSGDGYSFSDETFWGGEGEGTNWQGGLVIAGRIYNGDPNQSADGYLANFQSPSVAYRGTAYVTFDGWIGNAPTMPKVAFVVERYPNNVGLLSNKHKIGVDCNPVEVLYEILTNAEWGMGLTAGDIDVSTFVDAGNTLYDEGNGWGYLWQESMSLRELRKAVEKQIAGSVYLDPADGLFKLKLIRDDYTLASQPLVDESNTLQVRSFTRPAWNETTNTVRVKYQSRSKNYETTYAIANDLANAQVTQGPNTLEIDFPGCKTAALANDLAWRELREASYPYARIGLTVNRDLYGVVPGDVLRFSHAQYGIEEMAVRVISVDYGSIGAGEIRLECIEDVFYALDGSYLPPDDSEDDGEPDDLIPFGTSDQFAIEAPAGLVYLTDTPNNLGPRIASGARSDIDSAAVRFRVKYRNSVSSGGQTGSYIDLGLVASDFAYIGTLNSSLAGLNSSFPAQGTLDINIDITSADYSLDDLFEAWNYAADNIHSLGWGLCVIEPGTANEEWILAQDIVDSGTGVQLVNIYRGALDSVPKAHSSGARVWFWFALGTGVTDDTVTISRYYDVKLIPESLWEALDDADATACTEFYVASGYRALCPLPPDELNINGGRYPASVSAQYATGSGDGLLFEYSPKNWRTTSPLLAVQHKNNPTTAFDWDSAATFDLSVANPDGLAFNWWIYDLDTTPSPSGRGDAILNGSTSVGDVSFVVLRADILTATGGGSAPSSMRIEIEADHAPISSYQSRESLVYDFSVTDP